MNKYPVIIVGMHRSGTTMISRLVDKAGIFLGRRKENNNEPLTFIRINEWILRNANASWDSPEMFQFADDKFLDAMADVTLQYLRNRGLRSFAGRRRARILSGNNSQMFKWGWKDPRNSITLPVWQRVFPESRIIHVYRNPFDVARSLRKRSLEIEPDNGLIAGQKKRYMVGRVKYHESLRVQKLEEGFKLWKIYTSSCLSIPAPVHHVKYEDFLAYPEQEWGKLCEFLDLDVPLSQLDFEADVSRSYAYKNSETDKEAIERFSNNALVRQLGY